MERPRVGRQSHWDFFWKYNDGSDTFTLNKAKHYLSGLNFTTANKSKSIIFPNGSELITEQLDGLETAVRASLLNTLCMAGQRIRTQNL